jgi:superfamily II DNA helicase RecQ
MPFEILTIPFDFAKKIFSPEELNKFCINKKVLHKRIEFFKSEEKPYWSVFIEYETVLEPSGKESRGLTEAGSLCYERLREWRRTKAEQDGIPPFVIARNSQLVDIVKKEIKTFEALKQINGFGKKKIEKYGDDIIRIIKDFFEIKE